ncbi:MAG: formate dehydrogenase accessory sulfurtransferase FdhD [Candidatus Binataceae bacterium]
MNDLVIEHPALKWRHGAARGESDRLAVEEPLEIRLGGRRFTLTMRTPGHDEELAAGFLLAEGFISSRAELGEIRRVRGSRGVPEANTIDVILNVPASGLRERLKRNFVMSSSCGVCGKTSIDAIQRRIEPLAGGAIMSARALLKMPALMRAAQAVFSMTGGLHAAALFALDGGRAGSASVGTATDGGAAPSLIVLREDVGRHNAVDKVIGHALTHEMVPLAQVALMVSGRLSFEIVQKAAVAGIPILCAVSAPSSLAVELAEQVGMTLVGFLREPNFNVYAHPARIVA